MPSFLLAKDSKYFVIVLSNFVILQYEMNKNEIFKERTCGKCGQAKFPFRYDKCVICGEIFYGLFLEIKSQKNELYVIA
jgi:hypothetical protein